MMLEAKVIKFMFSKLRLDLSKNYYQVLELQSSASNDSIKKSYFRLAKKYHPDFNPEGKQKFSQVKQAYEILSNAENRKEYDKMRFQTYEKKTNQRKNSYQEHQRNQRRSTDELEKMRRKWTQQFLRDQKFTEREDSFGQNKKQKQEYSPKDEQYKKIQSLFSIKNPLWKMENLERLKTKRNKNFVEQFNLDVYWTNFKNRFINKK